MCFCLASFRTSQHFQNAVSLPGNKNQSTLPLSYSNIDYKVMLMMFKAVNGLGLEYLADLLKQDSPS